MNNLEKALGGLLALLLVVLASLSLSLRADLKALSSELNQPSQPTSYGGDTSLDTLTISGLTIGDITERWASTTMASASSSMRMQNTTGNRVLADRIEFDLSGGTATSSFRIFVATSTLSALDALTAPATDGTVILTATISTTTSGRWVAFASTTAELRNNEYLTAMLIAGDAGVAALCGQNVGAGFCSAATSTSRGFNPTMRVRYHSH